MSLETLVDEIRRRGETELAAVEQRRAAEEATIDAERERRVTEIREEAGRAASVDAARERARRLAAAKLTARKALYAAREARLTRSLKETRDLLSEFAGSPAYAGALKRMMKAATAELGPSIRVRGRKEDASVLARVAGKAFDPEPETILGGLVAETPDGQRRLNLSFDELLRLRGDRVRALLA